MPTIGICRGTRCCTPYGFDLGLAYYFLDWRTVWISSTISLYEDLGTVVQNAVISSELDFSQIEHPSLTDYISIIQMFQIVFCSGAKG